MLVDDMSEGTGGILGINRSSLRLDVTASLVEVAAAADAAAKPGSSHRSEPMLGRLRGTPDCVCRRLWVPERLRRTGD
jgi:hypothetical protein